MPPADCTTSRRKWRDASARRSRSSRCTGASAPTSWPPAKQAALESLSDVASDDEGDTIYAIDRVAEHVLIDEIGRTIATATAPVVLVAEGLPGGRVIVPEGADASRAAWTIIVDPIDGTRGPDVSEAARLDPDGRRAHQPWQPGQPEQRPATALSDIELAVQTEIPLVKQHLCDEMWAVRGQGVRRRASTG